MMIAAEIRGEAATVRIHDTCCGHASPDCLSRVNRIVSDSYRRRSTEKLAAEGAGNGERAHGAVCKISSQVAV